MNILQGFLYTAAIVLIALMPFSSPAQVAWVQHVASTVNQDNELAIGMAIDASANLYATGWFDGTNDFGGVTLTNKPGGGQDIFVAKYSSSGVLQWARRAGGSTGLQDVGRGIGVDGSGNAYVAGGFSGTADFGSFNVVAGSYRDFFLARYNSSGTVEWVQQAHAGNSAYGTGVATDSSGNCYVVGYFDGGNMAFGSTTLISSGEYNAFLVKFNSSGVVQWAKSFDSPDMSYSTAVSLDASGNVCVTGSFGLSLSIGATSFTSFGAKDGFVAKFNSAGTLLWARQMGGTSDDGGLGSATVGPSGEVYVVGGFGNSAGNVIAFGSGVTLTNAGGGLPGAGVGDAFIAKYNSAGTIQWAKRAGGAQMDAYTGAATDLEGNVYVAGGTGGTGMPSGFNTVVSKYDASGLLQWTRTSTGTDGALSWAGPLLDAGTNCYVAGWFHNSVAFGTNTLTGNGYWDYFIAKVGTNLTTGALRVTLAPAEAVSAGAQWQVDGGAWLGSGVTVESLAPGNHSVSYKSISGWDTPGNQTVAIAVGATNLVGASYIRQLGSLQVTLAPVGAINAGARWQVDGGPWQVSGTVINGLTVGNHVVAFNSVSNWITPANQTVAIAANVTAFASGMYVGNGQPVVPAPIMCAFQVNSITMAYPIDPGQLYVLQFTDDLTPPVTWQAMMPLVSSPISFSTGPAPRRFFRIRVGASLVAPVLSMNVVGYVRRTLQPGLNLVGNPLNSCNGNYIGSLFPSCPQGSEILLPNGGGSLVSGSVYSGGMWDQPYLNLPPGQGVGFVNPGAAFEVVFGGEVAQESLTRTLYPGTSLVSSILPVSGLLNFPAQEGQQIVRWNATNQSDVVYEYSAGAWRDFGWQPVTPAISPGEAFWVQVSQLTQWTQPLGGWDDVEAWTFPIIAEHPQSQTSTPGTPTQFAVSALGAAPLNYQWRKDGTNLLNTGRILGVNSTTLTLTNTQPGDAGAYTVVITNTYGSETSQTAVLSVSLPPPAIITTNAAFGMTNGEFGFSLTGLSGKTLVIEGSVDLVSWLALRTNTLSSSPLYFSDPQSPANQQRFYRARFLP